MNRSRSSVLAAQVVVGVALLGCAGAGLERYPGYSRMFELNGSFLVGESGADGLRWAPQAVGDHYEGVVIATWCPTCEALLAQREQDPRLRKATENLFYLDTELRQRIDHLTEQGELGEDDRRAALEGMAGGQILMFPERLPAGARAVHKAEIPAEWFPFFFTCDGNTCEGWAAEL